MARNDEENYFQVGFALPARQRWHSQQLRGAARNPQCEIVYPCLEECLKF